MQSGQDMPSQRNGKALLGQRMAKRTKSPFDITVRALELAGQLPTGIAERHPAHQLIRSGTSVGTSVEEEDVSESTRDRAHKLRIAQRGQIVEVLVPSDRRNRYW